MVLHLISDDKFTDYAILQFEKVNPGNNLFLVDSKNVNTPLKYVKKSELTQLKIVKRGSAEAENFIASISSNLTSIVIHNLTHYRAHLTNIFGDNIKVCWVFYGHDVYESFKIYKKLNYLPRTKFIGQFLDIKSNLRNLFRPLFFTIIHRRVNWKLSKKDVLPKINVFANANSEGFKDMSQKLNFYPEWVWHSYYDLDEMLKNRNIKSRVTHNNILIGNSATATNNHLDAFDELQKIDKTFYSRIVIPLNYGNSLYKNIVKKDAKKQFDSSVDFLEDFLPLEEYDKILKTCKYQIMNHVRPQATGNIILGLTMGAIVFLNLKNPLYKYFKNLGIQVFSIQNDLKKMNQIELSESEIASNYSILKERYSQKSILEGAKSML